MGPASDPASEVGPLISARAADNVRRLIDQAVADGRARRRAGAASRREGYYVAPTLLTAVAPTASILRQEIFGPVAPIVVWDDEQQLRRWVNDTEYGLAAYVYAGRLQDALRIAGSIDAGMVGVNRGVVSDPSAPFGGTKQSGLGREGARRGAARIPGDAVPQRRRLLTGSVGRTTDHFDSALRAVCTREALIEGEQGRVESLCERDIKRVPPADGIPQLPDPVEHPPVPIPLTRPVAQVRHRLARGGAVQATTQVLGADHPQHLYVDHLGRSLVGVGGQPGGDFLRAGGIRYDFESGRRRQRRALGHSPRHSSRVANTSAVETSEGRLPVRRNHSAIEGRAANREASRRRSSGTVMPSSPARRTNPAYTSSSMSRICTVLGIFAS